MNKTSTEDKVKRRVCIERGCRRTAINDTAPSPKEYVGGKSKTLFGWTLLLYKETVEYLCDYCNDCLIDRQQEAGRQAYDAGYEKGYNEAPTSR